MTNVQLSLDIRSIQVLKISSAELLACYTSVTAKPGLQMCRRILTADLIYTEKTPNGNFGSKQLFLVWKERFVVFYIWIEEHLCGISVDRSRTLLFRYKYWLPGHSIAIKTGLGKSVKLS